MKTKEKIRAVPALDNTKMIRPPDKHLPGLLQRRVIISWPEPPPHASDSKTAERRRSVLWQTAFSGAFYERIMTNYWKALTPWFAKVKIVYERRCTAPTPFFSGRNSRDTAG
jgi:hypothetical protein